MGLYNQGEDSPQTNEQIKKGLVEEYWNKIPEDTVKSFSAERRSSMQSTIDKLVQYKMQNTNNDKARPSPAFPAKEKAGPLIRPEVAVNKLKSKRLRLDGIGYMDPGTIDTFIKDEISMRIKEREGISAQVKDNVDIAFGNPEMPPIQNEETVKEYNDRLFATGFFQMTPNTMKWLVDSNPEITGDSIYNKETQDALGNALIKHSAGKYLDGGEMSIEEAAKRLAVQWRSLAVKSGGSYDATDANIASITYEDVTSALKKSKEAGNYEALYEIIGKGESGKEGYKAYNQGTLGTEKKFGKERIIDPTDIDRDITSMTIDEILKESEKGIYYIED